MMNNEDIKLTLANHGIGFHEINGRILANDVFTYQENGQVKAGCMQVDVTGFSKLELKIWLGY